MNGPDHVPKFATVEWDGMVGLPAARLLPRDLRIGEERGHVREEIFDGALPVVEGPLGSCIE
jgi:hypothetical protein